MAIFNADIYPIAEVNQALKLKIHYGYLSGLETILQTKYGKSIRSAIFDKSKFTKETAEKWLKDCETSISDISEDDKFIYAGLRKFSEFAESDVFERVNIDEGIDLLVKFVKPEILQILKEERELFLEFGKVIRRDGAEYCVYTHDGSKKLGCHKTKEEAVAQLRAIEVNKAAGTYDVQRLGEDLGTVINHLTGGIEKATFTVDEMKARYKAIVEKNIRMENGKHCLYNDKGEKVGEFATHEEAEAAMMNMMNKSTNNLKVIKSENGVVDFDLEIPIEKYNESEGIVIGKVYSPNVVDLQGDSATAEEIEKACDRFNVEAKTLGIMHKSDAGDRATILQSYISPANFKFGNGYVTKGTWLMKIKVNDPVLKEAVKSGKIKGLSMAGQARSG